MHSGTELSGFRAVFMSDITFSKDLIVLCLQGVSLTKTIWQFIQIVLTIIICKLLSNLKLSNIFKILYLLAHQLFLLFILFFG